MTHEEIRSGLMGALDGTLDPQELDEVELHVADCADCQLEQVELHRMRRSIDREDRALEASASGPRRWGVIGLGGWVRLLLLAAAVLVFGWTLRRAPAASPSSEPAKASPPEDDGIVTVVMVPPSGR